MKFSGEEMKTLSEIIDQFNDYAPISMMSYSKEKLFKNIEQFTPLVEDIIERGGCDTENTKRLINSLWMAYEWNMQPNLIGITEEDVEKLPEIGDWKLPEVNSETKLSTLALKIGNAYCITSCVNGDWEFVIIDTENQLNGKQTHLEWIPKFEKLCKHIVTNQLHHVGAQDTQFRKTSELNSVPKEMKQKKNVMMRKFHEIYVVLHKELRAFTEKEEA